MIICRGGWSELVALDLLLLLLLFAFPSTQGKHGVKIVGGGWIDHL